MDRLPAKYLVIWAIAGLVILALAGVLLYSLIPRSKPAPVTESNPSSAPARVIPQDQDGKQPKPVNTGIEVQRNNPELNYLLPATNEDGTPFVLTDASEQANLGFKALKQKQFQQAINHYKMATELDPRYEPTLKRTEELLAEIRRSGFDRAKNMRVFPGDKLTYKQLYNWE